MTFLARHLTDTQGGLSDWGDALSPHILQPFLVKVG